MKRGLLIACLLLVGSFFSIFAEEADIELTYYQDKEKGFSGYVSADLLENAVDFLADLMLQSIMLPLFEESFTPLEKISENDLWLVDQSLKGKKIQEGDLYMVFCSSTEELEAGVFVLVRFSQKKGTQKWSYSFTREQLLAFFEADALEEE